MALLWGHYRDNIWMASLLAGKANSEELEELEELTRRAQCACLPSRFQTKLKTETGKDIDRERCKL